MLGKIWKWRYDYKKSRYSPSAEAKALGDSLTWEQLYPITLNVLADSNYDEPKIIAFLDQLRPKSVLIMNNSDFALRVQNRYPEMRVFYRLWPDDNAATKYDPVARFYRMAGDVPDKRIGLVSDNEPSYNKATADYQIKFMEIADKEGRWCGVLGAGMGGPEPYQWESFMQNVQIILEDGDPTTLQKKLIKETMLSILAVQETFLAPMLRALDASNKMRSIAGDNPHVILLHEYFDFHNPYKPGWDPLNGENWLIGRFHFLYNACLKLGLELPPIFISEHGSDSLTDIYHGWKAGVQLPEETYAKYLIDLNRQVYENFCDFGQAIFCWTGGDKWSTFNVKDATKLQELLIADAAKWRQEHTEMCQDSTRKIMIVDGDGLAFRSDWGLASSVIKRFRAGERLDIILLAGSKFADNNEWVNIILQSTGENGWIAKGFVTFEDPPSDTEDIQVIRAKLTEALATIERQQIDLETIGSEIEDLRRYQEVFTKLLVFVEGFEELR